MRIVSVALALVALTVDARAADDPRALLHRGIQLYREASYAASVAALEQARQSPALGANEQTECGFYLAADYVALGSMQAARRELRAVLEAQPGYELPPYTSPKVGALFKEVQSDLERLPRLRALPPRRKGNQIELWFETSRTGGTSWGAAMWRWHGEDAWREAPLGHVEDKLVTTIEIDRNGPLEYWAEARGPQGVAQVASKERPMELGVTGFVASTPAPRATALVVQPAPAHDTKKKSIAGAWWLWTSVGVVVAAGVGVGLYYALRPAAGGTGDAVLDFKVQ